MIPPTDIDRLLGIVAALRHPDTGCAWDLRQSHASLAPYALEEAHEVVDAIERDDMAGLRDELGDLLLQVVLHARLAEEVGAFAFADVVEAVSAKMVRRHPHVFAAPLDVFAAPLERSGPPGPDAARVAETWEAIKAGERSARGGQGQASPGLLDDIAVALPALSRAVKLQTRAAGVGFDWHDAKAVLAKIEEEAREVGHALDEGSREAVADEIGDLFFALANLARHAGVDPEQAVRGTNAKFVRRFGYIERLLRQQDIPLEAATLEQMEALWTEAKAGGL